MTMNPMGKYAPIADIPLQNRKWPSQKITKAPVWCSVDLRDGNQALVNPMGIETKLAFFDLLVKLGFKEIEVGFPAASDTEYEFIRRLIDENRIPEDVTIQVLCQAREKLVKKTIECLKGAPRAIFHIYNSTSPAQRKYTFGKSKEEIKQIAIDGVKCIKSCISEEDRKRIRLEYSPESFSMTEIDYAVEICEAVKAEWGCSASEKIIFNLPTTVECSTPNVYADQIESKGLKGVACRIHLGEDAFDVLVPTPGIHMVYNALAAAAVGRIYGLTIEEIRRGIESLETIRGRFKMIETDKFLVVDDCYNANPMSMKASLDVLHDGEGRRVAILGDMGELGEDEATLHEGVGTHAATCGIDVCVCVGDLAVHIAEAAHKVNPDFPVYYEKTRESLLEHLNDYVQKGDTILVKASHFMKFEEVVKALEEM